MNGNNPILLGQVEVIDLVQPQVADMLDKPGLYCGGDAKNPALMVPLVSGDGKVFSLQVDSELNPELFLETLTLKGPLRPDAPHFDLIAHLERQREFSERTFGPGPRVEMVLAHVRKELIEIEQAPSDLKEWIDLILLGFDGAWRAGFTPDQIADGLATKLAINEKRNWPDWRTADPNSAIEHIKPTAS